MDPGLSFWKWRQQAQVAASLAGIPVRELDLLLEQMTGWTALDRVLQRVPPHVDLALLQRLWQQRIQERIPVQYLTGLVSWRNLRLQVSPSVLIPRPETEMLVDLALERAGDHPAGIWVDLGTGSGALAIALARALPQAEIYAVDLSPSALEIAAANVAFYQLQDRIRLVQGSWFEPLHSLRGRIRGMVSNPPYIPSHCIPELQPEVRLHEPLLALDGGATGFEALTQLMEQAPEYLSSGGVWLVEVMQGQALTMQEHLQQSGHFREILLHPDLAGIDRVVSAVNQ